MTRQAQHRKRQREKGFKAFELELSPEDQSMLSSLAQKLNVSQSEALRVSAREALAKMERE